MTPSLLAARVFTIILSAVTGAGVGFVLTFTHRQYVLPVAGIPVPLGLLGGLAIVAALLIGMRLAFGDRIAPLSAGLGVMAAIGVLGIPLPSGSTLYANDPIDYAWIFAPVIISAAVVFWPERRATSRSW
jgi:hypothetical protein